MAKSNKMDFSDERIYALKPAAVNERYEVRDSRTPGLRIRVTRSEKIFLYYGRFGESTIPVRRNLFKFDVTKDLKQDLQTQEARAIAQSWYRLIKKEIDPRVKEAEDAAAEAIAKQNELERQNAEKEAIERKRRNTFRAVIEAYLDYIPTRKRNRHADQDAREIRRELLDPDRNKYLDTPIYEIKATHIASIIAAIRDRPAPAMAMNTWQHVKALFAWAMIPEDETLSFQLETNPIQYLTPKRLKLEKKIATRVLSDDEIRAFWRVAENTPYPLGPFYKMLLMTGQRKSEVSDARWREFDLKAKTWTIPEERFKTSRSHVVPLTQEMIDLIESLPRYKTADHDCLFSTRNGELPINGFSQAKQSLHTGMIAELSEQANGAEIKLPGWTFHDIRRTVRTKLAELNINTEIAEMCIGHSRATVLEQTYNQHSYLNQKREAFERWAGLLKQLTGATAPANVIRFPGA